MCSGSDVQKRRILPTLQLVESFLPEKDGCQSWVLMGVKEGFSQERPDSPRVVLCCWEKGAELLVSWEAVRRRWVWPAEAVCVVRNHKVNLNLSVGEGGVTAESQQGIWLQWGEWPWDCWEWTQGDRLVGPLPRPRKLRVPGDGAAALRSTSEAEIAWRSGSGQRSWERAVRSLPVRSRSYSR